MTQGYFYHHDTGRNRVGKIILYPSVFPLAIRLFPRIVIEKIWGTRNWDMYKDEGLWGALRLYMGCGIILHQVHLAYTLVISCNVREGVCHQQRVGGKYINNLWPAARVQNGVSTSSYQSVEESRRAVLADFSPILGYILSQY